MAPGFGIWIYATKEDRWEREKKKTQQHRWKVKYRRSEPVVGILQATFGKRKHEVQQRKI